MRLTIQHHTRYSYSSGVFLQPHALYLKPQQRGYVRLEAERLRVWPQPQALHERIDMLGNSCWLMWFPAERTDSFTVDLTLELELAEVNPYGFILLDAPQLPFQQYVYPEKMQGFLAPFLESEQDLALEAFARACMAQNRDLVSFLAQMAAVIHAEWQHEIRLTPDLWAPARTFQLKRGACRDLSWMLVHLLRQVGLATRYVSGYTYSSEAVEGHELHAWVEVFLPGAGWVGLDPSLGLLADGGYIPLAMGYHPEQVAPLQGILQGMQKPD
ncbi:transglutaminase domain-containing protein [Nitritalea halalkaliphila LW7]|uniref:Transglutaminase domain-containing protein n=1 Tax=Nitritalea halalkaliphila LW7 TaxID=1189621 RepID=I5C8B9_9BACT|nr:transglutaminase family protein [Nitritalea halalkaliphila]EIM78071.1 transglutaminase domain-containing protein [Nitritalea halalkaliphila LW7]